MKESVLKRVLGVVRRAEHAIAVCEQSRSVGFDEVTKCVLVAVMGRFNQVTLWSDHFALSILLTVRTISHCGLPQSYPKAFAAVGRRSRRTHVPSLLPDQHCAARR